MSLELHYLDTCEETHDAPANGTPLVILHGLFGSADNWRSHIKHWRETRRVIAVDLRNHGRSPHEAGMAYTAMADDVLALLDRLAVAQFDLLGHSMGGKVAITMARRTPERIVHLIVADIAPIAYDHDHDEIIEAMRRVAAQRPTSRKEADAIMADIIDNAATRMFLTTNLVRDEHGTLAWRVGLANIADDYAEIAASPGGEGAFAGNTLVLRGSRSDYVSDDTLDALHQVLPNARLVTLEDAGHWLHTEQPARFQQEVEAFLD